uniref:Transposase (Putative), gypsy type n=1 Tax=Tanacetum cinerariifolium TaxID=118510 RepID=A0A6L2N5Y4_TANCI|nr:hypothetical protein [Tanacetum cinerariifolium]GEU81914.1 hypothetical protein [Tanacetum cinerariifolium]
MSAITDIRCAFTQNAFNAFCDKFHIPREVHPLLPNENDTMHERPSGKTGLYNSELEASGEKLFNEGGSGNKMEQGYSTRGEVSHPAKKLREDCGTPSGAFVGGSPDLRSKAYVSTAPEREDGDHTDFVADPNLHTIGASRRFVISSDSSYHSRTNVGEAEVDSLTRSSVLIMKIVTTTTSTINPTWVTKEKFVKPSPFGAGSSSAGRINPIMGVFLDLFGSDFLVGAIRTIINPDTDLRKVYGELLKAREEEIESLKARLLLREAKVVEAFCLRAKASNFETVEKSLRDETNALREPNVILEKEQNSLYVKVVELETSAMSKECELIDLNALVTSIQSQNDSLVDWVYELEISSFVLLEKVMVYENCMALHLEEKFYPHILTTIPGRMWFLTHGMELDVANYLNLLKYLFILGEAIGKAIKNGMQDGLSARITHGKEGRVFSKARFSLLTRLKSSKDASVETVMNILRLEGPLTEKLGLNELQPIVNHLMVPIHHSPDQVVVGATAMSLALDVFSARVQKIRENIANKRSALYGVFVPLAEPFSAAVLTGTEGTSDTAAVTTDTIMVLSTTFAYANTIAPISVDDYEVMGVDDQAVADENAASFPGVDDAKLNIP